MRKVILGIVGLVALQAPAMAASGACDAVAEEWRAAAFSSPAKPSQARVLGRAGIETSGPEFQTMVRAIRQTCLAGDEATGLQKAAVAETLLRRATGGR